MRRECKIRLRPCWTGFRCGLPLLPVQEACVECGFQGGIVADVWNFLFLSGEFAPRTYILEGLTLQDVGTRPSGASHSIYEELWHTVV